VRKALDDPATVAMSDVLALCHALIDHATFVRALEAGPLAMPYELRKVSSMDAGAHSAGFAVQLALKDINLAAELAAPSPRLGVVLERAVAAGHGGGDLVAVDYLHLSRIDACAGSLRPGERQGVRRGLSSVYLGPLPGPPASRHVPRSRRSSSPVRPANPSQGEPTTRRSPPPRSRADRRASLLAGVWVKIPRTAWC
jgi:hypothetical protein